MTLRIPLNRNGKGGGGEAAMSQKQTILVVGLIAEDETPTEFFPHASFADFEEQTVYEVVIRLKTGRPLPACLMTTVSCQEELLRLARAVEGKGIRLALMTDERTRAKPQSVDELLAHLPKLQRFRRVWHEAP
jgi:hypothetical protein